MYKWGKREADAKFRGIVAESHDRDGSVRLLYHKVAYRPGVSPQK